MQKKPYNQATDRSLRVMCYNILAPSLVAKVDYGDTKPEHINWENRLKQIQREIMWAAPHILCLQELEDKSDLI